MSHVFGPVPSRRLGRSLGIDPIPFKTCNFNCVYCQLGRTTAMRGERRDFFPPEEILADVEAALAKHVREIDWLTVTGEGEPTLCRSLGHILREIRKMTDLPIAVITNGGLLHQEDVRADLAESDLVMPSLDAADPETFGRIDRPHGRLEIEAIIEGIAQFRREFSGRVWLEIMLVRGVNDGDESLRALRAAIDRIEPDRVWLNTPVRPPAEGGVEIPDASVLERAREILGESSVPDPAPRTAMAVGPDDPAGALLDVLRRHPLRADQVPDAFPSLGSEAIETLLDNLRREGRLREIRRGGDVYLAPIEGRYADSP